MNYSISRNISKGERTRAENTLENKIAVDVGSAINGINKLIGEVETLKSSIRDVIDLKPFQSLIDQSMLTNKILGTINTNIANLGSELRNSLGATPIQEINQAIERTPKQIGITEQSILSLADKLKETEARFRAIGETAKANKIKEMLKTINVEATDVKSSMIELRQYIERTFGTEALKQFDKELKKIDKTTQNVGKKSNFGKSLRTALGIGTVALGIRKAVGFFKEANTEAVDYAETVNLFNVAMGKKTDQYGNLDKEASKYYTKAIAFQEKLSEKLGINIEESMNYQALFNSMSKSMGIADEYAYKLSENFTKLGYDLSSLFNINTENAMQKLRAGLSGQTKPLRDLGLDITQQSLEPLLDELGIERSVKQLSQAEKMVARYIVVLRQASLAHGDFAKTINSPANQLRIFNAQLTAFKRNMGSLWQGLLGNILPYVNAIMMVINELLKMVAKLFGYEVWEQDVSISAGVGADDLAEDLGTAIGKAKELKKQLMGFDEINNITLPDKTSGGSGGGASVGGIDKRLLDAMKEYDNLMDRVKSKATEIRDKILDWLGFTDGSYENLKKIWEVVKSIGTAFITWKISNTITKFLENLGVLDKVKGFKIAVGITLTVTGFENWISGLNKGDLLQSILGALTTGGGIWLTTGSLSIALPVTLTLSLISITKKIDDTYKIDEKAWKPLYDAFGFEYSNDFNLVQWWTRVKIGFKLVDVGFNVLSEALEKFKSWIREIVYEVSICFINVASSAFSWIPGFKEKIEDAKQFLNTAIDNEKKRREELTVTTEELNKRILLSEQLKNAITSENNDKIKESLNKLAETYKVVGEETENNLLQQISAQQQYATDIKEIYEKAGKEINEETKNSLDKRIRILGDKLVEQTNKVEILTPDQIEAWRKLAEGSEQIYNEKISQVGEDTRQEIQKAINEINNKKPEAKSASEGLVDESLTGAKNKVQDKNSGASKIGEWFVSGLLGSLKSKSALDGAYSAGFSFVARALLGGKEAQNSNSPAKETMKLGNYFTEGYILGLKEKQAEVKKVSENLVGTALKELNKFDSAGFTINPDDFKIDTSQFIDYGEISGAIATQNNIKVDSDIEGRIENAIYSAFSNVTIPVEIEATTDEGVVFKKVQVKAREFTMQTGEPAFDF